jgi:hypothetical protein
VQYVDAQLGALMHVIETDPVLKNDTVIVLTADHGGFEMEHTDATSATNYTIPVMVWGQGVTAATDLYSLNTDTRLDPGTEQFAYTAANQPIRNGDTGNLALSLLGLGPIPDSLINYAQDLRVASLFSADFNGNLDVDRADLVILREEYGSSALAHSLPGDSDGDNDVDGRDFLRWQRQYGSSLEGLVEQTDVPEPTGIVLSIIMFAIYAPERRTSRRRSRSSSLL